MQDETHVNRLKDLEAEKLVAMLFSRSTGKSLGDTLDKMEVEALVKTLAYTRAEVDAKQTWEHTSRLQGRSTD